MGLAVTVLLRFVIINRFHLFNTNEIGRKWGRESNGLLDGLEVSDKNIVNNNNVFEQNYDFSVPNPSRLQIQFDLSRSEYSASSLVESDSHVQLVFTSPPRYCFNKKIILSTVKSNSPPEVGLWYPRSSLSDQVVCSLVLALTMPLPFDRHVMSEKIPEVEYSFSPTEFLVFLSRRRKGEILLLSFQTSLIFNADSRRLSLM